MIDLSDTVKPNSKQLNADDFIAGQSITIKITGVSKLVGDQSVKINFEGDNGKPYLPCKSMRRVLITIWGKDGSKYEGRSLTLFRDEKVRFGPSEVGGIRISHMSHIDSPITMALTASKTSRKPYTVKPLVEKEFDLETKKLKEEGEAVATMGTEAYTKWGKALSPEQREKIKEYITFWMATAKDVDEKGGL